MGQIELKWYKKTFSAKKYQFWRQNAESAFFSFWSVKYTPVAILTWNFISVDKFLICTTGENLVVIRCLDPEILGGGLYHPPSFWDLCQNTSFYEGLMQQLVA